MRCLAVLAALTLLAAPTALAQAQGMPVRVAEARTQAVEEWFRALGEVVAAERVAITPQQAGAVRELLVAEGDRVEAGQPLVQMDEQRAQAELRSAESVLTLARETLQRSATLGAQGLRARSDLERDRTFLAVAESDMEVKRVALAQLTLRAPFDGIVTRRLVSPGALVQPGSAVLEVQTLGPPRLRFRVPQSLADEVRAGQRVRLPAPQTAEGRVLRVEPAIDPATRLLRVTAEFDAAAPLRPGAAQPALLLRRVAPQAVVVPEAAVVFGLSGPAVFVLEGGQARRVAVETGERDGGLVEIRRGVAAGARVVTEGAFRLEDGATVQVIAP